MKYQFYIYITDPTAYNTAAYKAIDDCRDILSSLGYRDLSFHYHHKSKDLAAILNLAKGLFRFIRTVKKGSFVAVQYPLLAGNRYFKYLIKLLRLKNVKFFCIVHDLDAIRYAHVNPNLAGQEIENLNRYDFVIAHNSVMSEWLRDKGLNSDKIISLEIFDYLIGRKISVSESKSGENRTIAFAGNLVKSSFIYDLDKIQGWTFNLYGPNFKEERGRDLGNVNWKGSFSSDEIVEKMEGDFGLIWDGEHIEEPDPVFGAYLRYNNPHKFSLYLAAGLPVIAPANSAIADIIREHKIGLLINSLFELPELHISSGCYSEMTERVRAIREKIISGKHLTLAVEAVECQLIKSNRG